MRQFKIEQVPLIGKKSKQLPHIQAKLRPVKMHKMISTEEWLKKQEEAKRKEEKRKQTLSTPKSEGTLRVYASKPRTSFRTPETIRKYHRSYYARNKDKIRAYQRNYYYKHSISSYEPDYQI
jgi:hypothetical protein